MFPSLVLFGLLCAADVPAQESPVAALPAVSGTVKDDQGREQADVVVAAISYFAAPPKTWLTMTDAKGKFQFKYLRLSAECTLVVTALKRGWFAEQVVLKFDQPSVQSAAIVLKPAQTRTITVLDPDGKPVPNAVVSKLMYVNSEPPKQSVSLFDFSEQFPLRSDAQGQIALDILPGAKIWTDLTVQTPLWGEQEHQFQAEDEGTFRLLPVGKFSGRLVAPAGLSAKGIQVFIESRDPKGSFKFSDRFTVGRTQVLTDAEGRFTLLHLAAGDVSVAAYLDLAQPLRPPLGAGRTWARVPLAVGGAGEVELTLTRALKVTGLVLEAGTDRPVVGATVGPRASGEPIAVTDAAGRYSLYIDRTNVRVDVKSAPPPYRVFSAPSAGKAGRIDADVLELDPIELRK